MSVGANSAHEESVGMKHGEEGPSSAAAAAAAASAGPSLAGEESSAGGATASDQGGSFDCNICLELAQDPVVTLCGHLFCWPCLYRWLQMHSICQECPVCKASVEEEKVIPLYGRGKVNCVDPRTKAVPGLNIPHRPAGQRPETARQAEHQYPPQGFNFMAGSAGPAATARFGLGFDGERRFSEPVSGFFTEPLVFFNDERWISNDEGGTFVNYDVNEVPFMDANGGPGDVDGYEGPFVDANEGLPLNAREDQNHGNDGPFLDANEGPPVVEESPNDSNEGRSPVTITYFITQSPPVNATEGPFEDAYDVLPTNANEGLVADANEGHPVDAVEAPIIIADEGPSSAIANEGPPIVNEGPPPVANEGPPSVANDVPPPVASESPPIVNKVPPTVGNEGPSEAPPVNVNESIPVNKIEALPVDVK